MGKTFTFKHTKLACYFVYIAMASVFTLPPLLFATFKEMYGISYTLLGTLVVINFCTQLGVDLIFSFFSRYFNIHKTIRFMPVFTSVGLVLYAVTPVLFPDHAYFGLLISTFVFSIAAGLGEVLISPVIAALPSDTPDRDMSALHSIYGYGVVGVVIVSTLFLKVFGRENWTVLTLLWAILPVISAVFLKLVPLPEMDMDHGSDNSQHSSFKTHGIALCFACIFLGSCAENTISNWISAYVEKALLLPKVWGDIGGMCMFAALLALTRTTYAKYGKNIYKVLKLSMLVSVILYVVVAFSENTILSLVSCALLGITTAMLWPGTLILMEEKMPGLGVTAYALMAAGGDMGASICPQLVGIVIDGISASGWAEAFCTTLSITPEQLGFKAAMLVTALFPAMGYLLLLYIKHFFNKTNT